MKVLIMISIILIGIFILFQIYISMSSKKTETQTYKVIRVEPGFEIRYYPTATMAMISSSLHTYRDLGRSGFGKLAKYIFGGNSEKKKIAMTSPVHMNIGEAKSTMAFVIPSAYQLADLPKPNDSGISLLKTEPEYVAVVQFGGFASEAMINKQKRILEKLLQEKGLSFHGNFRFLGYNPPFQIFNRKNEVIVALDAIEVNKS